MMSLVSDNFRLPKGWQLGKSQSESTLCLFRAEKYADVWFRCKDQEKSNESDRIAGHKLILASRSPIFEDMFYGEMSEPVTELDLPGTEKIPFLLFLRFLYSDTTDLSEEHAVSVMRIAHEYQVSACKEFCSRFLQEALCSENVCTIRESTRHFADEMLSKSIMNFIDDNAACVIKSKGFMAVDKNSLEYILKGNTFFAPELDIIQAVDRWAEHYLTKRGIMVDAQSKRQAMGKAFYYLRLPTLSPKDFLTAQFKYTYLSPEEQTNASRFIIEKADIDLCNSREERLPRKGERMMSFSEPGAREIPKNIPVESHAILKCSKVIDVVEVFLVKVSKETEVTCTVMTSAGVEKAKIEINLLPSENPSIKFDPPITLDASGGPFKLIIKTTPLDTKVSAEELTSNKQVAMRSIDLKHSSSGLTLASAKADPFIFGSKSDARTASGTTPVTKPFVFGTTPAPGTTLTSTTLNPSFVFGSTVEAKPATRGKDKSILTPKSVQQKFNSNVASPSRFSLPVNVAIQANRFEMEIEKAAEHEPRHVTLQDVGISQLVHGIRYVNQSGRDEEHINEYPIRNDNF